MPEKFSPALFEEFPKSDKEGWKQQLSHDLPQTNYSDLIWKPTNDLDLEPLYTRQEWSEKRYGYITATPDSFPKIFENRAYSMFSSQDDMHSDIQEKIKMGADGVVLDLGGQPGVPPSILKGIDLAKTAITLVNASDPDHAVGQLTAMAPSNKSLKGSLYSLPMKRVSDQNLLNYEGFEALANLMNRYPDLTDFKILGIRGPNRANFRSNPARELAFILALTIAHLDALDSHGCSYSQSFPNLEIEVAIGDSFFLEIGKIRALRFLVQKIGKLLELQPAVSSAFRIHAGIESPIESEESPLIRTTTRAISSILGGANSISIRCDSGSDLVDRAAIEIPTVLGYESSFADLADPCYGSYYIDRISGSVAERAWEEFQFIERSGGISKFLNYHPDYPDTNEG